MPYQYSALSQFDVDPDDDIADDDLDILVEDSSSSSSEDNEDRRRKQTKEEEDLTVGDDDVFRGASEDCAKEEEAHEPATLTVSEIIDSSTSAIGMKKPRTSSSLDECDDQARFIFPKNPVITN